MKRDRGSALLLVLFICVGSALAVVGLSAVLLSGERGLAEEAAGRLQAREARVLLEDLCQVANDHWNASIVDASVAVEGLTACRSLSLPSAVVQSSPGWFLDASVTVSTKSAQVQLGAEIERGRDGLDIPSAALVADGVEAAVDRTVPVVYEEPAAGANGPLAESGAEAAPAVYTRIAMTADLLSAAFRALAIQDDWSLDEGTRALLPSSGESAGLRYLSGQTGLTIPWPSGCGLQSSAPVVLVVAGGAELDARGLGDVYGVVVVDGGTILLDGTRLHGALYVTGRAVLGGTGQVVYDRVIRRCATDHCLWRTRPLPGSLVEERGPTTPDP